jgi:hypothetical protein
MSEKPKLDEIVVPLPNSEMGEPIPMIGNLPNVSPSQHWRPIESAPKDGRELLLYGADGIHIAAWSDRFCHGMWDTGYASECDGDPIEVDRPTHWMHLPETP